jgi:hypothetical protein
MSRLVFWYGVKFEERGQAYSFVPSSKLVDYEEGESKGYSEMPKKIQNKIDKKAKLTKTEEQMMRGLIEIKKDMARDKSERIKWMMSFQEDYEVAESQTEPAKEEGKIKRKPGRPKKTDVDGEPVKRKPGRPKKSDADGDEAPSTKKKAGRPKKEEKSSKKSTSKKFVIIDGDQDSALESDDDDDDEDFNDESSDGGKGADMNVDSDNESEDGDDERSGKGGPRKRKAQSIEKKPKKRSKANMTEEEIKEERKRKAAEYREKKRREKAEALGLDYVPGRKKSKKKIAEEEQQRFTECEDVFLPLIDSLREGKNDHDVDSVLKNIGAILEKVEMLTPPFLRAYPLGMLVREVRKTFEGSGPEVKNHCKRLTNEMKRVYTEKEKSIPEDFVPVKRKKVKAAALAEAKKPEPVVDVPEPKSAAEYTDPVQSNGFLEQVSADAVKSEPPKQKKTFSIKGMFEKPKLAPKPRAAPTAVSSGPVSPKPKSLPSWVTGPALKMVDFHEQHAKERNFALEFLSDAASTMSSEKVDPLSVSQSLELAIFAETKLRGRDWKQYWEKVHDVVAMLSPGKDQPNAIMLGIVRGDYQDSSELVKLSRREIQSLNQQRLKRD